MCLLIFVLLKIPALTLPFFWDESWSYAPAIQLMHQHGPSLAPDAIDTAYSRGHPLLFYALCSSWTHLFGMSHISMHIFALSVAVLFIIVLFEVALRMFGAFVANCMVPITCASLFFYVQSTMVLPEIIVSLFALLSLYFFASNRYFLSSTCLSLLVFTKESGLTAALALGLCALANFSNKKARTKDKLGAILAVSTPVLLISFFFVWQKQLHGWYLFPEHMGYINISWLAVKGKLRYFTEIIFYQQYRYLLFLSVPALSIAAAIKHKKIAYLLPLAITGVVILFTGEYFGMLTRKLLIPFLYLLFIAQILLINKHTAVGKEGKYFMVASMIFALCYLSFCSINFFSIRYLTIVIVIFTLAAVYSASFYLSCLSKPWWYITGICWLVSSALPYTRDHKMGDTELLARPAMEVQEKMIGFLEQSHYYKRNITAPGFLQREQLLKPLTGMRHTTDTFMYVQSTLSDSTEVILIDNIEPDSIKNSIIIDKNKFAPVFEVAKEGVIGIIYLKIGT